MPAFGQIIGELLQNLHHGTADVVGGRKIAVPLEKAQDILPHPFAGDGLICLAQQREQRAGKPVARFHLGEKKLPEALSVHAEQLEKFRYFLCQPCLKARRHRQPPQPSDRLEDLRSQIGSLPQILQKDLEIGVIPQGRGLQRIIGAALVGSGIRPAHSGRVGNILDLCIVGLDGGGYGPVVVWPVIIGYRICDPHQIRHNLSPFLLGRAPSRLQFFRMEMTFSICMLLIF